MRIDKHNSRDPGMCIPNVGVVFCKIKRKYIQNAKERSISNNLGGPE